MELCVYQVPGGGGGGGEREARPRGQHLRAWPPNALRLPPRARGIRRRRHTSAPMTARLRPTPTLNSKMWLLGKRRRAGFPYDMPGRNGTARPGLGRRGAGVRQQQAATLASCALAGALAGARARVRPRAGLRAGGRAHAARPRRATWARRVGKRRVAHARVGGFGEGPAHRAPGGHADPAHATPQPRTPGRPARPLHWPSGTPRQRLCPPSTVRESNSSPTNTIIPVRGPSSKWRGE